MPNFTEGIKNSDLMAQMFHYFALFRKRYFLPASPVFRIMVGVQSGFASNGFVEAEHG